MSTVSRDRTADTPPRTGAVQSDIGLLLLRLVLATSFVGHGAQKVFGAFDGSGIHGFAQGTLAGYGFRFPEVLAWITGLTELLGGLAVAVGVFTPLAATGLMAVMINTVLLKFHNGFFFQLPGGFEVDFLLAGLAAGLVLAGPGRLALDSVGVLHRVLARRWAFLVLGVVAGLAFYFLLRT
ncbi:membrane protein [Marmoricola endophyticus]|uniref:Membrane protein n=1 Tax=Marmoricola endophyticus TaxID=2040280 RepID=A0A917F0L2_9ACTN|nr:DoxX family protein [Marmoricola endophyticus]GGF32903.1 membrane protein [Marmoricola endophyticus]